MRTQFIDSKLYYHLYSQTKVDSFGAIAVYSTLLKDRKGRNLYKSYRNTNGKPKAGYTLLANEVSISKTALKKYIPELIRLGLCYFTTNGSFVLKGKEKIKEEFKNTKNKKVPIKISHKLCETKNSAKAVIIHSNIQSQKKAIDYKRTLMKTKRLKTVENAKISKKDLKAFENAVKNGFNFENPNLVENTLLSNIGLGALISTDGCDDRQTLKERGKRLKNNLNKRGNLISRRRFRSVSKKMSFNEYSRLKPSLKKNNTFRKGRIVEEIVPEVFWFTTFDLNINRGATHYNSNSIYKYINKKVESFKPIVGNEKKQML